MIIKLNEKPKEMCRNISRNQCGSTGERRFFSPYPAGSLDVEKFSQRQRRAEGYWVIPCQNIQSSLRPSLGFLLFL